MTNGGGSTSKSMMKTTSVSTKKHERKNMKLLENLIQVCDNNTRYFIGNTCGTSEEGTAVDGDRNDETVKNVVNSRRTALNDLPSYIPL